MKKFVILFGILLAVAVLFGVGTYNQLVGRRETIQESWAQVENVLQRRYDLIPNLVNTVKGYAAHERGIFEEVTRLRSQWAAAKTLEQKVQATQQLESALSRLLAVAENYPDLKASQNFLSLQDELAGTENRIAVERRRYNESIRSYNVLVRGFPGSLIAGFTGFTPNSAYFEAAAGAKQVPKVEF